MPGIWNIGNGYNLNSKKISRKLSFEAGEQFTGRVVSKGEGKDITIKLADGWQFIAELDGDVNVEDLKLVNAIDLMLKKSVSRLIIKDNNNSLLGIVTRTDLIEAIIKF